MSISDELVDYHRILKHHQHGMTFITATDLSDAEHCVVSCLNSEANRTLTGWVSHVEVGHSHPASLSSTVGPLHVAVDLHGRAIGSLNLVVAWRGRWVAAKKLSTCSGRVTSREVVVVDGLSSVFPSAVHHLVEGYFDHTGRMAVISQDRQLEWRHSHHSTVADKELTNKYT